MKMAEANISNTLDQLKLVDSESMKGVLDLPNEVLVKIFKMLGQEDILKNVARVCKRFLEITRSSEVLPIVRIFSNRADKIYAKKIQNCHGIYPASKIETDIYFTQYSDLEQLQHVSNLIKYMTIGFCLDSNREDSIPTFCNLEYLGLHDIANPLSDGPRCHLDEVPKFWSRFPNLTYLHFSFLNMVFRTVSVREELGKLLILSLKIFSAIEVGVRTYLLRSNNDFFNSCFSQ